MTDKTGGPAFPNVPDGAGDKWERWDEGMTLRDYFASKAMQGDFASQSNEVGVYDKRMSDEQINEIADFYYRIADAMLRARGK